MEIGHGRALARNKRTTRRGWFATGGCHVTHDIVHFQRKLFPHVHLRFGSLTHVQTLPHTYLWSSVKNELYGKHENSIWNFGGKRSGQHSLSRRCRFMRYTAPPEIIQSAGNPFERRICLKKFWTECRSSDEKASRSNWFPDEKWAPVKFEAQLPLSNHGNWILNYSEELNKLLPMNDRRKRYSSGSTGRIEYSIIILMNI